METITPSARMPAEEGDFVTTQLNGTVLSFLEYPKQIFDLSGLQGDDPQRLLFSVNKNGDISINAKEDFWLIATVDTPGKTYTEMKQKDGEGNLVSVMRPNSIVKGDLNIIIWRLSRVLFLA